MLICGKSCANSMVEQDLCCLPLLMISSKKRITISFLLLNPSLQTFFMRRWEMYITGSFKKMK